MAADDRTEGLLVERGEFSRFDLHEACWEYLHDLGPDQGLASRNPLIVALAVLSAKVGKRRLLALASDRSAMHPLAAALLAFRLRIEDIVPAKQSPSA